MTTSWRTWLPIHPAAELFPLEPPETVRKWAEDMKRWGQRVPCTYIRDNAGPLLLDGRNRLDARELAGLRIDINDRAVFEQLSASIDQIAYIVSLNLHRRQLTPSQCAMVAAGLATLQHGVRQSGKFAGVPTQQEAAALLNISERSVRSAAEVRDHGAPELQRAVEQGRVSVSAAADIATAPLEEQREIVARGEDEILRKAKEIRTRRIEEHREARRQSRSAAPIPDGIELRIGDCRRVLADIPDNSVPLILTDPPYGDEGEPLYSWLADFAARVLITGGSLICYTGHSRLPRDHAIFSERLRFWWELCVPFDQKQQLPGKFVIVGWRPILWYVKDHRRGRSMLTDVLKSVADKSEHRWAQGTGGVEFIIEHLTDPGELIVDPFAGTGAWGRIAADMGRRWLGADIAQGGTESVQAEAILEPPHDPDDGLGIPGSLLREGTP
jgi:hypothetical protein